MQIDDLRALLHVVSYSSLSEAARQGYTTQQTLSRKLSQVEQEVGCKLLDRTTPIAPTPAGKVFLRNAARVVTAYDRLLGETRAVGAEPPVSVCVKSYGNSSLSVLMASLVSGLSQRYPNIELTRTQENIDDIDLVREGRIDIGFVRDIERDGISLYRHVSGIRYQLLESNSFPLVFAACEGSPLLELSEPTLADIAQYRIGFPTYSSRGALPLAIERAFASERLPLEVEPVCCSNLVEYFSEISSEAVIFFNEVDESRLEYISTLAGARYVPIVPSDALRLVRTYAVCSEDATEATTLAMHELALADAELQS